MSHVATVVVVVVVMMSFDLSSREVQ